VKAKLRVEKISLTVVDVIRPCVAKMPVLNSTQSKTNVLKYPDSVNFLVFLLIAWTLQLLHKISYGLTTPKMPGLQIS